MAFVYIIIGILVVATIILATNGERSASKKQKATFHYIRKDFFLTRAEHDFYDTLTSAIGAEYQVFAQVHLPTLLEHKIPGQNWRAAFTHICQKSVDFVLCEKTNLLPKLAIEVDDITHQRLERQERDHEVERIFQEAAIPLLRIENHGHFNASELAQQIREKLLKN